MKQRPQFDWRKGVCQFCDDPAKNGCCDKHSMKCPTCDGYGTTTKENWHKLYGKGTNDNFLKDALLALQVHDPDYEIKIWFDGSHYDQGDEPAIKIFHKGEEIYSEWGIFLPSLILEAATFMKKRKSIT